MLLHNVKSMVKISSIFVAFLENMNFIYVQISFFDKEFFPPTFEFLPSRSKMCID